MRKVGQRIILFDSRVAVPEASNLRRFLASYDVVRATTSIRVIRRVSTSAGRDKPSPLVAGGYGLPRQDQPAENLEGLVTRSPFTSGI